MPANFLIWLDAELEELRAKLNEAVDDMADNYLIATLAARLADVAMIRAEAGSYEEA